MRKQSNLPQNLIAKNCYQFFLAYYETLSQSSAKVDSHPLELSFEYPRPLLGEKGRSDILGTNISKKHVHFPFERSELKVDV